MTPEQIAGVWARSRRLYSHTEVGLALDRMAGEISQRLDGHAPILMCIMHGGLITTAQLALRLDMPLQLDYLHATRYREATRGADLQWQVRPSLLLEGRNVVLVDDILDEGDTLAQVKDYCLGEGCREVTAAVLINKIHDRKVAGSAAEFIGLEAPDHYLFGYGMDYRGYLRNANGIYAIDDTDR